jgi:hypothetical protein
MSSRLAIIHPFSIQALEEILTFCAVSENSSLKIIIKMTQNNPRPVSEQPFRIIYEGIDLIFDGFFIIFRGVWTILQGGWLIFAGILLDAALLFASYCVCFFCNIVFSIYEIFKIIYVLITKTTRVCNFPRTGASTQTTPGTIALIPNECSANQR